jgi:hypothetical protein
MLCQGGLTPVHVRELLAHLGAVDADTSRWHLGEMTGKPAKYVCSPLPGSFASCWLNKKQRLHYSNIFKYKLVATILFKSKHRV